MGVTGLEPHDKTPVKRGFLENDGAESGADCTEKPEMEGKSGDTGGTLSDAITGVLVLDIDDTRKAKIIEALVMNAEAIS
jgi:hypothetical protein